MCILLCECVYVDVFACVCSDYYNWTLTLKKIKEQRRRCFLLYNDPPATHLQKSQEDLCAHTSNRTHTLTATSFCKLNVPLSVSLCLILSDCNMSNKQTHAYKNTLVCPQKSMLSHKSCSLGSLHAMFYTFHTT